MKIEINGKQLLTGKVDGQGRKYLGRNLSDAAVTIAVLDVTIDGEELDDEEIAELLNG